MAVSSTQNFWRTIRRLATGVALAGATAAAIGSPLIAASPGSQWTFAETAGTTAFDATGSNNGTLVNGVIRIVNGQVGGALTFDGVDDYVSVADSASLESSQFSVSLWVRRNGAQGDWAKIVNKGRGDVAPWASYKFEFNGASDTTVNWHLGFANGTSAVVQNVTPLPDGQWMHLAGTYNGLVMKLYVNGRLESRREISRAVKFDATPLTIGGYAGWGYFHGDVDEVRYAAYALSDAEVRGVYSTGPALAVTAPNTSVDWLVGSLQTVQWTHSLAASSTSKIDLSRDGGVSWAPIGSAVNGNLAGVYDWTVAGPATTHARIRVASQTGETDVSDVDFRISAPLITVTSPNTSNDVWIAGQQATVSWSSNLGAAENVRLDLSIDGGASFPITIAASTPSDGSETILVPGDWETTAARVKVTWLRDSTVADISDGNSRIDPAALVTVAFQPTTALFTNPERGFFIGGDLLTQTSFTYVKNAGRSLVKSYVRLDAYRNVPLPATVLNQLSTGFSRVRQAGIKVIVRFTYNFGPYPNSDPDASLPQIQQHLQQLAPILSANADVISSMEAGFIGAWGEWHTSTNGLDTDPAAKAAVLNAVLAALPASRMVALRYPSDMQQLNGGAILPQEAFSGTNRARIGSHQDCFLASDDDWGTWGRSGNSYAFDKAYVAANGRFAVVGGETCNWNPPRSDCPTALAELAYLHWSYLNEQYEPTVVQGFRNGGCMNEIDRRLGYRLAFTSGSYTGTVKRGTNLRVTLQLANEGFAAMFNARPVFAVLDGAGAKYVFQLGVDPRTWEPGVPVSIDQNLALPATMTPGTYTLSLWMPDNELTLRNNPAYAVRFANVGVWDAATGYNVITRTITITQ